MTAEPLADVASADQALATQRREQVEQALKTLDRLRRSTPDPAGQDGARHRSRRRLLHSSATARDRDRLRQEQLERLGWRFHRIWSTDWFNDPDTCIAKARVAYEQAVAAADAGSQSSTTGLSPAGVDTELNRSQNLGTAPTRAGSRPPVPPGHPITEYLSSELVDLIRWIQSDTLLRTEDQLFEEFMREVGFQRRGPRIRDAFNGAFIESRHRLD